MRSFAYRRRLVLARRAFRDEEAVMTAAGYRRHETDWEIHRGARFRDIVVDAKISQCGKYVWTKLGSPDATPSSAGNQTPTPDVE